MKTNLFFYNKDEFQIHSCLHRASYQTIGSLSPFVALFGTEYASIFPGCRHVAFYKNYLDVIVHIFQEHLESIDKDYYCILWQVASFRMLLKTDFFPSLGSDLQYIQKQDAKRHAKTATEGAVHVCDSLGW